MNTKALDMIMTVSPGLTAELSSQKLLELKTASDALTAYAKSVAERIDHALFLKYGKKAQVLRLENGKDTGTVHILDGDVRISADLPKRIEWDQDILAQLAQQLAAQGDDPADYIQVSYRVSETAFNTWSDSRKQLFMPARTQKTGKQNFKLNVVGGAQ